MQTIVHAAGWGAVPPVIVVLFHSIPFRFISFRTHGIPWQCKNVFATSEIERQLAEAPSSSLCVGVARIALCQWHFIACFWAWIEKLPAPQTHSESPPVARAEVRIMLATENCSPPYWASSLRNTTQKRGMGFTWFKWQAETPTNGQLGESIQL